MDARDARQVLVGLLQPEVVEALLVIYPDRAPRERLSEFDLGVTVGERKVIDFLITVRGQQAKATGVITDRFRTDSLIRELEAMKGSAQKVTGEVPPTEPLQVAPARDPAGTPSGALSVPADPTGASTPAGPSFRATLPKEAAEKRPSSGRSSPVDSELAKLLRSGVRVRQSER